MQVLDKKVEIEIGIFGGKGMIVCMITFPSASREE
jgi:hypothetical protein